MTTLRGIAPQVCFSVFFSGPLIRQLRVSDFVVCKQRVFFLDPEGTQTPLTAGNFSFTDARKWACMSIQVPHNYTDYRPQQFNTLGGSLPQFPYLRIRDFFGNHTPTDQIHPFPMNVILNPPQFIGGGVVV